MPRPKDGYRMSDGTKVPGVTDITGRYMDKGALIGWAFKRGQSGAASLYEGSALDIGSVVHRMIELDILGRPATERATELARLADLPAIDKARAAFGQFEQWRTRYHMEVECQEISLVSERYAYGGTLDWIVKVNGRRALLDFKTGKSTAVYPAACAQGRPRAAGAAAAIRSGADRRAAARRGSAHAVDRDPRFPRQGRRGQAGMEGVI